MENKEEVKKHDQLLEGLQEAQHEEDLDQSQIDENPENLFHISFSPEVGRITFTGKLFEKVKQKSADWLFYKLVTYVVTKSVTKSDLEHHKQDTLKRVRTSLAIPDTEMSDRNLYDILSLLVNVHDNRKRQTNALNLDGTVTKFLNPGLIIISGTSNTGKTAVLQKICSSIDNNPTPLISIYEPQIDLAKIMSLCTDKDGKNEDNKKQHFSVVGGLSLFDTKIAIDSLTEILLTVPPGYATNKGGYSTPHIKSQLAVLDCYCACTGATVIATLNTLGPSIEISVMDAINSVASLHIDLNAQKIHYRTLSDRHTVSVSSITINNGESIWLNSDSGFITTSIKRDGQIFFIESEGHYSDKEVSVSQLAGENNLTTLDNHELDDYSSNFSSIVVK